MTTIPSDQHITYQLQYRKCGKASCSTCRNGQGHGPYWYAYWRVGSRLRSGYIGKVRPSQLSTAASVTTKELAEQPVAVAHSYAVSAASATTTTSSARR
ncbi:hypothetical protein [Dictyobacter arantiisoli]|uniref:DUF6788 domain-containing protein n=1 Tax=Dictyobacter arantiisoli TaxID=2014874 RepID=A0A5A5TCW1_9CHLR|nr:hypothetical protein [Dictyobacter arantiisoli]GCF09158.1 hypothetical protein KDI_27220 [Dictyobacter arantiisoli]